VKTKAAKTEVSAVPPHERRFTLDGKPVVLGEFLADNEAFEADDLEAIDALGVGESISFGGGAAPRFVFKREG
jgi:hypothetical protein